MYGRMLRSVLLPGYYALRGREYHVHRQFLERSQWWPEERLVEFQWQETKKLLQHAFETVPYYQKKYCDAGITLQDIRTPEDFAQLPPLTREEVNTYRDDLKSRRFTGKLLPKATGGSSGVPTRFFITYDSFDWRMAVTARAYSWTGCNLGEHSLHLWGAPVGRVSRFTAYKDLTFRMLRGERIFNTFVQDDERWRCVYTWAKRYKPHLIVGFVSSLEQFCRFLLRNSLRLDAVKAVIGAAEPVFRSTRDLVASALGAPLFNTYGSREFMSIAAECECHDGLHINPENLLVETELPSARGPSEILVTDLHNYGMPFVRYRIGDLGVLSKTGICECGRALPKISSIEGRTLDAFRTRSGQVVPGEWVPHVVKEIPEVDEFQAQQLNLDEILLLIVSREPLSHESRSLLEREFQKVFGCYIKLIVKEVPTIPRLASGKRRVTVGMQS